MKLNNTQINAIANKVLNEIQIVKTNEVNSKENIKIIEEFKEKYKELNDIIQNTNKKLNDLTLVYSKKLNIKDSYYLKNNYDVETLLLKINKIIPNIDSIKQEIILNSITENPNDLESFISKLIIKFQ